MVPQHFLCGEPHRSRRVPLSTADLDLFSMVTTRDSVLSQASSRVQLPFLAQLDNAAPLTFSCCRGNILSFISAFGELGPGAGSLLCGWSAHHEGGQTAKSPRMGAAVTWPRRELHF